MGGHPGYLRLLEEMAGLHRKKAADYGLGADPLANLRASAELGIQPWRATLGKASDKWSRLKTYCQTGRLENEGVEDAFKDLASYALLALVLFREEADGTPPAGGVGPG